MQQEGLHGAVDFPCSPRRTQSRADVHCSCGWDHAMADTHTASLGEPLQGKWIFLMKTQLTRDHTAGGFPEGLQPVEFLG